MISTRFRNSLTILVAMLIIVSSSQGAVCELACGVEIEKMSCHAHAEASAVTAMDAPDTMSMTDGHCTHERASEAMQISMQACGENNCTHASMPVLAKAGSAAGTHFAAMQWVTVDVVPMQLSLTGGTAGLGGRPPLLAAGVDPLVVSLRV